MQKKFALSSFLTITFNMHEFMKKNTVCPQKMYTIVKTARAF